MSDKPVINIDVDALRQRIESNISCQCRVCHGTGSLKAKRKAMRFNGPPIDYDVILAPCTYCNGTGIAR